MANGTLTPPWFLAFTDSTGAPLAGGKIYTYITGTSTPVTVYQNSTLTTAWSNPIILPADGKVTIYQTSDIIKAVVYNSADVLQATYDPIMSSGTFIVDGPPNIVFTDAVGVTHTTAALVDADVTTVPSTTAVEALFMQTVLTPNASMAAKQALGMGSVIRVPSSNTQALGAVSSGVFIASVDSASGATASSNGISASGRYTGEGTATLVDGGQFYGTTSSSAVVATTRGSYSEAAALNTSSGTTLTGADVVVASLSSGTFTTAYGVRVVSITNTGGGTLTNTYGVYVGDVTSGTQTNQAYSFYASDTSARNYFAGSTVCGGAFACNGATAQTSASVGAALAAYTTGAFGLNSDANMQALYNTVVAMRAALVANGIAVV